MTYDNKYSIDVMVSDRTTNNIILSFPIDDDTKWESIKEALPKFIENFEAGKKEIENAIAKNIPF
jgi:hypothetical protein